MRSCRCNAGSGLASPEAKAARRVRGDVTTAPNVGAGLAGRDEDPVRAPLLLLPAPAPLTEANRPAAREVHDAGVAGRDDDGGRRRGRCLYMYMGELVHGVFERRDVGLEVVAPCAPATVSHTPPHLCASTHPPLFACLRLSSDRHPDRQQIELTRHRFALARTCAH